MAYRDSLERLSTRTEREGCLCEGGGGKDPMEREEMDCSEHMINYTIFFFLVLRRLPLVSYCPCHRNDNTA